MIVVGGEITTTSYINLQDLVRDVIRDIGYTDPTLRFDADSCAVINVINRQSPDIAQGVDTGGAGDQGMMFGYATKETSAYMPAPIYYSHRIMKKLADVRKKGRLMPYLRPDAKAQVSMVYNEDNEPISVDTIVVSTQHDPGVTNKRIREDLMEHVIGKVIPERLITKKTTYHINPTGKFEIGGPHGDTGLTGRKIIVDTYGGRAPHGGGAFSGKDPTKVDRSAAYAARHLAKNLVAAGVARECTIQVAYAIGVAKPVSIHVNTHGTSVIPGHIIEDFIRKHVDLTPAGIIKRLDLRRPIYRSTAAYGHFGRNEFPWEQLDLVALFKNGLA
jgi:S-adenosylmethionine synthetase